MIVSVGIEFGQDIREGLDEIQFDAVRVDRLIRFQEDGKKDGV